jgi:hypothetical protein
VVSPQDSMSVGIMMTASPQTPATTATASDGGAGMAVTTYAAGPVSP